MLVANAGGDLSVRYVVVGDEDGVDIPSTDIGSELKQSSKFCNLPGSFEAAVPHTSKPGSSAGFKVPDEVFAVSLATAENSLFKQFVVCV